MKKDLLKGSLVVALSAFMLTGCVDDDYDLTKEIDKTIGIGGDHLSIPASSTQLYGLGKIMNLDEENSSIKADAEGNYALQQSGDQTTSEINVDEVKLNDVHSNSDLGTTTFPAVPTGGVPAGHTYAVEIGGPGDGLWTSSMNKFVNNINVDSNDVPKEVLSVSHAELDMPVDLTLSAVFTNYSGPATIRQGFKIQFEDAVYVSPVSDCLNVSADNHALVFNRDVNFTNSTSVRFYITRMDVTSPNGIQADHNFIYKTDVISTGTLALDRESLNQQQGKEPSLDLTLTTQVLSGSKILQVTGKVDPEINVDPQKFELNDIPNFLREDGNNLALYNPQIYLKVENNSPAYATVNLMLTSFLEGAPKAKVDVKNVAIQPGTNLICVSKRGGKQGYTAYTADLDALLKTIPDYITVDVDTKVDTSREYTFRLGKKSNGEAYYNIVIDNDIEVPLSFDPSATISYTEREDDWNDDDVKKLSFNTVTITADVYNTIPMKFKPTAKPIFLNGYEPTVKVDTHGAVIEAGSLDNPAMSHITITLTGEEGKTLSGLNGIEYTFDGYDPTEGAQLNKKQGVWFDQVKIKAEGGIVIDLN